MTKEERKEFDDLVDRVRWLETMSGNTRKRARESNPYDLSQHGGLASLAKQRRR